MRPFGRKMCGGVNKYGLRGKKYHKNNAREKKKRKTRKKKKN
jgi:hypothetical protein